MPLGPCPYDERRDSSNTHAKALGAGDQHTTPTSQSGWITSAGHVLVLASFNLAQQVNAHPAEHTMGRREQAVRDMNRWPAMISLWARGERETKLTLAHWGSPSSCEEREGLWQPHKARFTTSASQSPGQGVRLVVRSVVV